MPAIEKALEEIRAIIGKDNHILFYEVKNNQLVATIAKRNVGNHSVPVSSCFHVSIAI